MIITSGDNSVAKLVRGLHRRKQRDREGLYLVEGPGLISEAIRHRQSIRYIVADTTYRGDLPVTHRVSERLFKDIGDTASPQNVLAVAEKRQEGIGGGRVLILDRIQDPANLGSMMRTARACGFDIVMLKGTVDVYAPKVVRAAAGAHFNVGFSTDVKPGSIGKLLDGYRIIASDMNGEKPYFDVKYDNRTAFVMGNEGGGIDDELYALVDETVRIPMMNEAESLNVSIAAAILMYETIRNETAGEAYARNIGTNTE